MGKGKAKKSGKKGKNGKESGGGFGKATVAFVLLLGVAGGAFWYLAPDEFQNQLGRLREMLGI